MSINTMCYSNFLLKINHPSFCKRLGLSLQKRFLIVSHTERGGRTRIINARLMDRNERKIYEEG